MSIECDDCKQPSELTFRWPSRWGVKEFCFDCFHKRDRPEYEKVMRKMNFYINSGNKNILKEIEQSKQKSHANQKGL